MPVRYSERSDLLMAGANLGTQRSKTGHEQVATLAVPYLHATSPRVATTRRQLQLSELKATSKKLDSFALSFVAQAI